MTHNEALLIIDMQRGFMPASEGERLGEAGFGELPVAGGELLIPKINELTMAFQGLRRNHVDWTRDAHPHQTAHFSEDPNYIDTWPPHCVFGTAGSELHPDLYIAQHGMFPGYLKGEQPCESPADDDSYSGALARNPFSGKLLPDELRANGIDTVTITGVALGDGAEHKLCVDSTAADFHNLGFNVTVVTDATEAVLPENKEICFRNLGDMGIRLATTEEVLNYARI